VGLGVAMKITVFCDETLFHGVQEGGSRILRNIGTGGVKGHVTYLRKRRHGEAAAR